MRDRIEGFRWSIRIERDPPVYSKSVWSLAELKLWCLFVLLVDDFDVVVLATRRRIIWCKFVKKKNLWPNHWPSLPALKPKKSQFLWTRTTGSDHSQLKIDLCGINYSAKAHPADLLLLPPKPTEQHQMRHCAFCLLLELIRRFYWDITWNK